MRVLVACEYSAIVRDAFLDKGHFAQSCDILPTEGDPAFHIEGDVLKILDRGWDMMIAHPPCTYLANSGVRWLVNKKGIFVPDRLRKLKKALIFFNALLEAPIPRICIENPITHKYCHTSEHGSVEFPNDYGLKIPKRDQCIQPWMFGDNESKAVCLWLRNLPPLVPDTLVKPENCEQRVWRMPPGPNRQKERSRFFKGIARAMADQWG